MESIAIIVLTFALGVFILWTSFTGKSSAPWITGLIGVWFIALPICLINEWYRAFFILLGLPLGIFWIVMAIFGITRPLRYSLKGEAVFVRPMFERKTRRRGFRLYSLECNYRFGGKGYQRRSQDCYTLEEIQRKYIEGSSLSVWVHKKEPTRFMVNRFYGFFSFWLLLGLGIAMIHVVVKAMTGNLVL